VKGKGGLDAVGAEEKEKNERKMDGEKKEILD
jgi:hypothetical protein